MMMEAWQNFKIQLNSQKKHNDMKIINIKDLVEYIKNNGYNKAEENSAEQASVVDE